MNLAFLKSKKKLQKTLPFLIKRTDDELSRQPTTEIPIDNPVTTLKLEERLTKHLSSIPLTWEPLLFNMAHSFRRLGKWAKGKESSYNIYILQRKSFCFVF